MKSILVPNNDSQDVVTSFRGISAYQCATVFKLRNKEVLQNNEIGSLCEKRPVDIIL